MKHHQAEFFAKFGDQEMMDKLEKNGLAEWYGAMIVHNPSASKEQLDKVLNSENSYDRAELASSDFATDEHLGQLVNDPDKQVRQQAHSTIGKRLRAMRNKELEAEYKG